MSKILMFVDAENVSREQVRNYLAEARSMLQETDTFVGKCYGSKDVLGSMISFFLENGLAISFSYHELEDFQKNWLSKIMSQKKSGVKFSRRILCHIMAEFIRRI